MEIYSKQTEIPVVPPLPFFFCLFNDSRRKKIGFKHTGCSWIRSEDEIEQIILCYKHKFLHLSYIFIHSFAGVFFWQDLEIILNIIKLNHSMACAEAMSKQFYFYGTGAIFAPVVVTATLTIHY